MAGTANDLVPVPSRTQPDPDQHELSKLAKNKLAQHKLDQTRSRLSRRWKLQHWTPLVQRPAAFTFRSLAVPSPKSTRDPV